MGDILSPVDFRTAQPIGRGSSGQVYRVRHPELGFDVALKVLHTSEPDLVARMLREAHNQSQVDHPQVAKVLDTGRLEDGRPWIAMELVDGVTLDEAAPTLSVEERVRLVMEIAQALHAAHSIGLIHRDVKPGNILVREVDGRLSPVVVDFGLAREISVPGPTMTGQALGTPGFMAPEQIGGQSSGLDRRTDVYGLGVVLYQVLSGRLPFEGTSQLDLIVEQAEGRVIPLKKANPDTPRDLILIVNRCLEKDRNLRYPSARALADDLDRYLNGVPVEARPAPLGVRLVGEIEMSARRSPRLTVGLAIALVVLLIGGVWTLWSRTQARRSTALATMLTVDAEGARSALEIAKLLPLHDIGPTIRSARSVALRVTAELERVQPAFRSGVLTALGRLDLTLNDPKKAVVRVDMMEVFGRADPRSEFVRAMALVRLYADATTAALTETIEIKRERGIDEARRKYGDPAKAALVRARGTSEKDSQFFRALVALAEDRRSDAETAASTSARSDPGRYPALELVGRIGRQNAYDFRWQGKYEAAQEALESAIIAIEEAVEVARSAPGAHLLLCEAWTEQVELDRAHGRPIDESSASALNACRNALRVNPDLHRARMLSARITWRLGQAAMGRGEDPNALADEVIVSAGRAFKNDPSLREAFNLEALGWAEKGRWKASLLEDPSDELNEAITVLHNGLAVHPDYGKALNTVGYSHLALAGWQNDANLDSGEALQLAVNAFERTVASDPDYLYAYNNLAITLRRLGDRATALGEPAEGFYRRSLAAVDSALERNPTYANALNTRGQTLHSMARSQGLGCSDTVEPILEAARVSFLSAAAIRKQVWHYPSNEAKAWLDSAEHALARNDDATVFLLGAGEAIDRAKAIWAAPQKNNMTRLRALSSGTYQPPDCTRRTFLDFVSFTLAHPRSPRKTTAPRPKKVNNVSPGTAKGWHPSFRPLFSVAKKPRRVLDDGADAAVACNGLLGERLGGDFLVVENKQRVAQIIATSTVRNGLLGDGHPAQQPLIEFIEMTLRIFEGTEVGQQESFGFE